MKIDERDLQLTKERFHGASIDSVCKLFEKPAQEFGESKVVFEEMQKAVLELREAIKDGSITSLRMMDLKEENEEAYHSLSKNIYKLTYQLPYVK